MSHDTSQDDSMTRNDTNFAGDTDFLISVGDWNLCRSGATQVRHEVFIVEQQVPPEEELDDRDAECVHALIYDREGRPIATGRLLPDGHIGRMAVLKEFRGRGLGSKVLQLLMREAQQRGHTEVVLAAQVYARGFIGRMDFMPKGRYSWMPE